MLEVLQQSSKKSGITIGSQVLIGSNTTAGFYGEIDSANFISGSALAAAIGLTSGTLINSATPWLKFFIDDKIVFIPKLPIRNSFFWQDIYQCGAVYGDGTYGKTPAGANRLQNARVSIGGYNFIVRLIKGANTDPVTAMTTDIDHISGSGSEWDRLFYNICDTTQTKTYQVGPNWSHYTEAQLGIASWYTWCQENATGTSPSRLIRGVAYVTSIVYGFLSSPYASCGWRPVLELIP